MRHVVLPVLCLWVLGGTVAAQTVYWTDEAAGTIVRADVGGTPTDLVTGQTHSKLGLAVDVVAGKIYWAHGDAGSWSILKANLDGSVIEPVLDTGARMAEGIAIDSSGGRIYWTEFDTGGFNISRVLSADLDGSDVTELVGGLTDPVGIALDLGGGKMYWTDPAIVHLIQRANLNGSEVESFTLAVNPFGIALDLEAGRMYWADFQTGEIASADLDGSSPDVLLGERDQPRGVALLEGKLYWTQQGEIQRADLDGGDVETLFSGLGTPAGLVVLAAAAGPLRLTVAPAALSWAPAGAALHFDLVRGDLGALRSRAGDFAQAAVSCLAADVTGTSVSFTDEPPAGEGIWLLARRVTAAGNESYDSDGTGQVGSRDAGISASGSDCP